MDKVINEITCTSNISNLKYDITLDGVVQNTKMSSINNPAVNFRQI